MAMRLVECHRVLKDTGSIYLHCDSTMSHYLKLLMDCIFDEKNFRDEIVWNVGSVSGYKSQKKGWVRNFDIILYYIKSSNFIFNKEYLPYREEYIRTMFKGWDEKKQLRYRQRGNKRYYENESKLSVGSNWTDILSLQTVTQSKEVTGFPTQKPLKLLERIINASSNEGSVVLDPFCGCATTCVAAELLNRQWIGIDISHLAYDLVRKRLEREVETLFNLNQIKYRIDPPKRTDEGKDYVEKKWVYVISHPKYKGEYKVGIATDWKSRLNAYQTASPDRAYKMEYKIHKENFDETEDYIHNKYPNKHEWVHGNLQDIINDIRHYRVKKATQSNLLE